MSFRWLNRSRIHIILHSEGQCRNTGHHCPSIVTYLLSCLVAMSSSETSSNSSSPWILLQFLQFLGHMIGLAPRWKCSTTSPAGLTWDWVEALKAVRVGCEFWAVSWALVCPCFSLLHTHLPAQCPSCWLQAPNQLQRPRLTNYGPQYKSGPFPFFFFGS